jgi:LmbE family N-acetylglucosaminyl deacetylase
MRRNNMKSLKMSLAVLLALAVTGRPQVFAGAEIPQDQGASFVWQQLLKLKTTASAMHTTAHPDDEHGGVLSQLSRGQGARLSLLTLNRGESGDNAIGAELFDGLGLIRTEELIDADRYYGVDDQYFTTVADYGFSKTIEEALSKWGKENVLRDVVRVIRMNRPFVLISRFQGTQRDGHGNHQTAGMITQEAFKAAGDPNMFPEQIAQGLRPWQPMKVYIGGQRENEEWTLRVDPGAYSPWLGETYSNFSRMGLAFQRSQNSGRLQLSRGPQYGYYRRVGSTVTSAAKEESFFEGIDTTIPGLFKTLGRTAPAGVDALLQTIDREVTNAVAAFSVMNPSATIPSLARGLKATRDALGALGASEPDAAFILKIKERQFESAITAALGVDFKAMAQPAGVPEATGPFAEFAPPPTMAAPVPGQAFEVRAFFTNRSPVEVTMRGISLATGAGWSASSTGNAPVSSLKNNATATQRFSVTLSNDAPLSSKPYFTRPTIQQSRYDLNEASQIHRPASETPAVAVARFTVEGVDVEAREGVTRREGNLPYGYEMRELRVVPALALTVTPGSAVVPLKALRKRVAVEVDLLNNVEGDIAGELSLKLPAGWTAAPASQSFKYARAGERSVYKFTVSIPSLENKGYEIQAVAKANGREYTEGYATIAKRDLETRLLYRPSTISVRGIDVAVPSGLKVGYVMGVGDSVPAGLAQLGASVTLLGEKELASGNLSQFDTIMTGTRAYAVREDLKTYNQRLLDYVKAGGNMVVLYNTQEFIPNKWAPYPAQLPARAEEVSEEDSPVEILAPTAPVFNFPNRITASDFENWVEQRGSKFFTEWDKAYTPMIATWDKGQEKQRGGWVHATYGKGHYTYFAYAFHRQLPYGVPGAYRLLGNVLSLNKAPTPGLPMPRP